MRRVMLAVGVVCAVGLTGRGTAQNAGPGMPGQVVGSYTGSVNPIGQRLPSVAPQAGLPVGANQNMRPYDPNRPYDMFKGTNFDPSSLVVPLTGPDGKPVTPPDALDRLSDKIKAFFVKNPPPPPPPYTPGITRRARERNDMRWRRD